MPTKKQKTTKRKSKKTGSKRASASGPKRPKTRSAAHPAIAKAICAITDPFCLGAIGSKIPDASSTKSLAWHAETWLDLTTDSSGRGAILFGADPSQYGAAVSSWFGASLQITGIAALVSLPGFVAYSSTGITYRLVSYGIQVRSVLSAMNNQGSLGIAAMPVDGNVIATTGIDLNVPNLFSSNVRQSMKEGTLSGISGHDDVVYKTFKDPGGAGAGQIGAFGNEVLIAYVTGGPASVTSAQVRVVYHYELVFPTNTTFNSLATKTQVSNPSVIEGSNFVQRTVGNVIKGGTEEVEKRVMGAAEVFGRYAVRVGAGAIGAYFGGPSGAIAGYSSAGMIMDQVD